MKRIASILLVVLMMASLLLTGCGKKDAAEPAASENAAATPSAEANNTAADADDFAYITDKGTLTIGITIYDPMNYYDDNGKLVNMGEWYIDMDNSDGLYIIGENGEKLSPYQDDAFYFYNEDGELMYMEYDNENDDDEFDFDYDDDAA